MLTYKLVIMRIKMLLTYDEMYKLYIILHLYINSCIFIKKSDFKDKLRHMYCIHRLSMHLYVSLCDTEVNWSRSQTLGVIVINEIVCMFQPRHHGAFGFTLFII